MEEQNSTQTSRKSSFLVPSIIIVFIIILLFGIFASRLYLSYRNFFADSDLQEDTSFVVNKGDRLDTIAENLAKAGLVKDKDEYKLWTKVKGKATSARAGEYLIPANASPFLIMNIVSSGNVIVHKITFQEGLTTDEMLKILDNDTALTGEVGEDFSLLVNGTLLPSTYHFSLGDSKESILRRMQETFNDRASKLWEQRQKDLPFDTLFEAIVLASIVEKETAIPSERPLVASVYINRLKKGMKLQSDPTVLFALTGGKPDEKRRVLYKDLKIDNPYNTYKYKGLPPTPICNVGIDSLKAVLNPAKTDYLYFVADADNPPAHIFSSTFKEHNKNAKDFRLKKKVERAELQKQAKIKEENDKKLSSIE